MRAALLAVGLCMGCATTGDLGRVHAQIAQVQRTVDEAVAQHAELQAVKADVDAAEAVAAQAAHDAQERGWTLAERIVGMTGALLALGGTGYGTFVAINAKRDGWRRRRGERTDKPSRKIKPAPRMGAE